MVRQNCFTYEIPDHDPQECHWCGRASFCLGGTSDPLRMPSSPLVPEGLSSVLSLVLHARELLLPSLPPLWDPLPLLPPLFKSLVAFSVAFAGSCSTTKYGKLPRGVLGKILSLAHFCLIILFLKDPSFR